MMIGNISTSDGLYSSNISTSDGLYSMMISAIYPHLTVCTA